MKWVEIIGLPGSGKSTLLQKLISTSINHNLKRKWISDHEILEKVGVDLEIIPRILNFIKYELYKVRKQIICSKKINTNYPDFKNLAKYHSVGMIGLNFPSVLRSDLELYYNNLLNKAEYLNYLSEKKIIFLDEGIIQNNFGVSKESFSKLNLKPSLVIFFQEDGGKTVNQIIAEGNLEKRGLLNYENNSRDELNFTFDLLKKLNYKKIQILKKSGVRCICVSRETTKNEKDIKNLLYRINLALS